MWNADFMRLRVVVGDVCFVGCRREYINFEDREPPRLHIVEGHAWTDALHTYKGYVFSSRRVVR